MRSDKLRSPQFPFEHYSANVLMVLRSVIHPFELIDVFIKQINRWS
jgi:hypothetical protein